MARITDKIYNDLLPKIENWKQLYPEVIMIKLSQDEFDGIFRVPTLEDIKLANSVQNDIDKNRQLVLSCLLYPEPEVFEQLLQKRAGIITPIATKLIEACGVTQEATIKKL